MKSLLLTLAVAPLFLAAPARAQWQDVSYTFKSGWNAVYLHGDASYTTLATLFASYPEVTEVWRWNPNPTQVQFTDSPQIPSAGTPEWSTWKRDGSVTSLSQMVGQSAYLVKCSSASPSARAIRQRAMPPSATWVRSGANLLGFPGFGTGASSPTFSSYFATFPAAIASNVKIYKYVGGDLGPGNPLQVFSTSSEKLDRNQAYWFQSAVVGNFYAPVEITPSNSNGLDFGRTGSTVTVRLRNRTAATVTLSITPTASAAAPSLQTAITGSVPLTRVNADGTSTALTVGSAITQVVGPQGTVDVTFGINRAGMSGTTTYYASLLRFTDSGSLLDVNLPVSAAPASLAGLWVGDAQVSAVTSKVAGSPGATTPRSFPLRFILHVDAAGTARLLSQVFMGTLANEGNPVGLCTKEAGLKQDAKDSARRMSVAHLPLDTVTSSGSGSVAPGSTLVRTVSIPYNDPTNPFVHTYHPDHDNLDARPDGTAVPLAAGVESHGITRQCTFQFASAPPTGVSSVGWGSAVIGGNYTEVLTGLHKETITVSGAFTLRRASEEAALTVN
jgi:hypothetical protein